MPEWCSRFATLRLLTLAACLATSGAALAPPTRAAPQADPVFILEPDRGPCMPGDPTFEPRILARGANFPPGSTIAFFVGEIGRQTGGEPPGSRTTVAADGTFVTQIHLFGCRAETPSGTRYNVQVESCGRPDGRCAIEEFVRARTTFTVDQDAPPLPALPRPTLALEPREGVCAAPEPRVVVRGALFPPGKTVQFNVSSGAPARGGQSAASPLLIVADDGTVAAQLSLPGCGPETPPGTEYLVVALTDVIPGRGGTLLARATFTVLPASAPLPGLPNTGGGGVLPRTSLPGGWLAAGGLVALLAVALGRVRRRAG
jgi:hypothetical protein